MGEGGTEGLVWALLTGARAGHPCRDGQGWREERGRKEESIKSLYLTCPPPTFLYLFANPEGSLLESFV